MKKLINNLEEYSQLKLWSYEDEPSKFPFILVYREVDPDPRPCYLEEVERVYLEDFE